jgi:hypothetical protein
VDPVINAEQAAWMIQGAASILIAGRDADNRPSLAQAMGSRISADRRTLVVFLLAGQAATVLRDLRANGCAAVTFTNSRSTRSLQLKANGAREVPLAPGDDERSTAHVGALIREWTGSGLPEPVARALLARRDGPLVAIELVPHVAFDQTPGPRAGTPLPTP